MTNSIYILLRQQSVVLMTLQKSQYITSISGIFSWLHHRHMKCLSNDFKLTETNVHFMFLLRDEVSFRPLLHNTCNYHVLLFLWFLLFSIFFGLEKGTHRRLLFGNPLPLSKNVTEMQLVLSLNIAFCICSICHFYKLFFLCFFKIEYCFFYIYHCIHWFLIHNFTNCGKAVNQRWPFFTEVKSVINRSPLSVFF